MIDNELLVMVMDEDGDLLGFIITNISIQYLKSIIDEKFETHKYNYDVDELVNDIREEGWSAKRVYLDGVEI